jgi:simple sugar transport system permease protein
VVATVAGLAAGWIALVLLVWAYGQSPREITGRMLLGTWGFGYGIGQCLYKATALLLTGTAVDLALRAGLFNVGGEGQLAAAGMIVGAVCSRLPGDVSTWAAVPVAAVTAAMAGAAWAALPALLRARFASSEVISTIVMNRLADVAIAWSMTGGLAIPGTLRTPDVPAGARLPKLDALGLPALRGSAASIALPVACLATFGLARWLSRFRVGRELVLVGIGPRACAAERIPVARRQGLALLLSGAIAGLAALGPVLGYKGYFEAGLSGGAGFGGIAVALLGRGHPLGMLLAALAFGTIEQGGLVINAFVPMDVVAVIEGIVVIALAMADARVRAVVKGGRP